MQKSFVYTCVCIQTTRQNEICVRSNFVNLQKTYPDSVQFEKGISIAKKMIRQYIVIKNESCVSPLLVKDIVTFLKKKHKKAHLSLGY